MTRHFAIIGAGPAGIYAAERLARVAKDDRVDIIDRLPTPFGLVRYGVAPDHQSTKTVTRILAKALGRDNVGFCGNVTVGETATLEEIRDCYDAVVLATGAPRDRALGVPGEDLPGVYGSIRFVGWYNGHPDHADLAPDLAQVRHAVVIGNGNVALDVARVLAKSPAEMAESDLDPDVRAALEAMPLETVTITGRRGAEAAKFTALELEEMGQLDRARPVVDPADVPGAAQEGDKIGALLRDFAGRDPDPDKPVEVRFAFNLTPAGFEGEGQLEAVRFTGPDGQELHLPAQLAVTCIGYRSIPCCTAEPQEGVFPNEDGKVEDGLYVVGWAKRGPSGTIPTNRKESHTVADKIAEEVAASGKPGQEGLQRLAARHGGRVITLADWEKIDAAEVARAEPGRPRHKFTSVDEMLAVLE
jgi:ferredoxin--NADP+ reductase